MADKLTLGGVQSPPKDDPVARAKARAEELRNRGALDTEQDEFYIDPAIVPDGWSYEWKRQTVLNAEDPSYQVNLAMRGWDPVPLSRHPDMMPSGWSGNTIDRKGMRLMERPKEITDEAKSAEKKAARDLLRSKEQQLHGVNPGQFERTLVNVKRSFEPGMAVPKE